jgi:TrmH family RNA methyltransferase
VHSIRSAANPQFRRWLRIAGTPRAVREGGLTLAEGVHLAQAARDAGVAVEAILLRQGSAHAEVAAVVADLSAHVPRFELAATLYDRLAPVEQGLGLMLVLPLPRPQLPRAAPVDMLYLDGIQDPGNVGTLIRTAAAAGVRHVLASAGTAALWSPRVLRAGMGAHFRVGLHEHVAVESLPGALRGEWLLAVAHDAPSLWEARLDAPALGWIFGAEGSGPSAQARAMAQRRVRIPTGSAVESLNVAAAAAVCLFERCRQRALARD